MVRVATSKSPEAAIKQRRPRLAPDERRRDIIDKAIVYFAEVGFEGGTRELAKRLGVTQPLLYRYFPSKEALIQEVYDTVYLQRWNDEWTDLLGDRSRPLRDRLIEFYSAYTDAIFTREWMRIFFFAGLKGLDIAKWYVAIVKKRVLRRICIEYRHELGLNSDGPLSEEELELAWTMHGGIFYHGIREHIYHMPNGGNRQELIANALDVYLNGARGLVRRLQKKSEHFGRDIAPSGAVIQLEK